MYSLASAIFGLLFNFSGPLYKTVSVDSPEILTWPWIENLLREKKSPPVGAEQEAFIRAEIEAVAMIIATNPDRQLYFLERDAGRLGLVAMLLARLSNDIDLQKQIHNIYVSRPILDGARLRRDELDPSAESNASEQEQRHLLLKYLSQEGVSQNAIEGSAHYTFIDTGFFGSIPRVIEDLYPDLKPDQVRTQLLVSGALDIPSARVFGTVLDPKFPSYPLYEHERTPWAPADPFPQRGDPVHHYAGKLPKRVHLARKYVEDSSGKIRPQFGGDDLFDRVNSLVDPKAWLAAAVDAATFLQTEPAQRLFSERLQTWQKLYRLYSSNEIAELKNELRRLVQTKEPAHEAIVRDFIEQTKTNLARLGPELNDSDVGLLPVTMGRGAIRIYAPLNFNPDAIESETTRLVAQGDFETLGKILETSLERRDSVRNKVFRSLSQMASNPNVVKFMLDTWATSPQQVWGLYKHFLLPAYRTDVGFPLEPVLISILKNITSNEVLEDIYKRFIKGSFSKSLEVTKAYVACLRSQPTLLNEYREAMIDILKTGETRVVDAGELLQFVVDYSMHSFQVLRVAAFLEEPVALRNPSLSQVRQAIALAIQQKAVAPLLDCAAKLRSFAKPTE